MNHHHSRVSRAPVANSDSSELGSPRSPGAPGEAQLARRPESHPQASGHTRALITAGPTHEPIDQVRFLGNRSSGRMGLALAEAAAQRGWSVTVLLGPIGAMALPESIADKGGAASTDSRIRLERFQTAADLRALLRRHWPAHDLLLMAAAVADYTIAQPSLGKLNRRDGPVMLQLQPTPDLLMDLKPLTRPDQTVIGFALEEPGRLRENAKTKLQSKRLDAIVANPLETMDSPEIDATLLWRDGREASPGSMSKERFAQWLLEEITAAITSRMVKSKDESST